MHIKLIFLIQLRDCILSGPLSVNIKPNTEKGPSILSLITMTMKVYNCVFQVTQTYPVTEDNFEITYSGQLILNMPPNGVPPNQTLSDNAAAFSSEENLKAIATTPGYDEEFQKTIERVAKGREVETIKLFKPENMSLGFSVVGLKGENNEETGIFVQDIQPGGIAARSVTLVYLSPLLLHVF